MEISLVTVIWSMIASACLTLAGIQLLVWCKTRDAWPNLLFSLTAVSTAAFAFCELRMMRASTPAEFASTLKWGQVPVWLLVVSLVGFVRVLLKAGQAERQAIIDALRAASGRIAGKGGAAERLGLKRTTLQNKMNKLNISRAGCTQ